MATPGVHSGYGEGYEKGGEAWSRYTTATGLTRSSSPFFFTSFLRSRRRRRSAWNCQREEHRRRPYLNMLYVRPFSSTLRSIILRRSLRGFKPSSVKSCTTHGCVIVICTSMNLSISLTESNRVFQANDALPPSRTTSAAYRIAIARGD